MVSDTLRGILKGKTNGAQLSIEEINEAIAEAGIAGITPGNGSVSLREGIDAYIGRHAEKVTKPPTIEEMNEAIANDGIGADLASLVAGCTPDNLHPESDFGPPVGREIPNQNEWAAGGPPLSTCLAACNAASLH
ncbi:AbrB/MazE/SpoVT family DNA-binding domain-containing protein [Burkholderia gladioli]